MTQDVLDFRMMKQIEYYFSDSNLEKDEFMQRHLRDNNGSLPIGILLTFPKVKK